MYQRKAIPYTAPAIMIEEGTAIQPNTHHCILEPIQPDTVNMFTGGICIEVTESAADPLLSVGWDTEVTLLYFIAVTENVLFPS